MTKKRILILEDPSQAFAIAPLLREEARAREFYFETAHRLKEVVRSLKQGGPDLLLVDVSHPDILQPKNLAPLFAGGSHVPIIVIGDSDDDDELAVSVVQEGAQDYLVRDSLDPRLLLRAMRYAIKRKRSEEQLRESEQRYKRLLDSVADYIYSVRVENGQSISSFHHDGCEAVTGYMPKDYYRDPLLWFKMIFEEDRPLINEHIAKVLKGEHPVSMEHRIYHKDGTLRWVRNTAVPRKDIRGRVTSYDGLIVDITERRRMQSRLLVQYAVAAILAESANLEGAASELLEAIGARMDWTAGTIWHVDSGATNVNLFAKWQLSDKASSELAVLEGFRQEILSHNEEIWLRQLDREERKTVDDDGSGARSAVGIMIPLRKESGKIIIAFLCRHEERWDPELREMLRTIRRQIAQFVVWRQTEDALAQERHLLRTLVDTLPVVTYVKDPDSRFVLANVSVASLMGAEHVEDLYGKTDFDFYPHELASQYYNDEQRLIESGEPIINKEEPVFTGSGEQRWLLTSKTPLRDLHGNIVGLVGIGKDITERKRENEKHRAIEARLQAIMDNTTAVIYIKDPDGRYVSINRQYERLFNVTNDGIQGKSDYDLFPEDACNRLRVNDDLVLQRGEAHEFEELVPDGNQARTYISIKFPLIIDGQVTGICGISTDITDRKLTEDQKEQACRELQESQEALKRTLSDLNTSHEALKATQKRLIEAEKFESIGTLAAGVAHEVKNPLQTILMGLNFLNNKPFARDSDTSVVVEDITEAVQRADSIVRGLLEYAAFGEFEMEAHDLNAIVRKTVELVRYQAMRNRVVVEQELEASLPMVKVDKGKVEQVFINLCLNAIQAMSQGGSLRLRSYSYTEGRNSEKGCGYDTDLGNIRYGNTGVVAEVEDSGPGVPEEKLDKLFDPFFSTKPAAQGTGLGLAMAKRIVDLHGGTISASNRAEGGLRVTVIFDSEAAVASQDKQRKEQKDHEGGAKTDFGRR